MNIQAALIATAIILVGGGIIVLALMFPVSAGILFLVGIVVFVWLVIYIEVADTNERKRADFTDLPG